MRETLTAADVRELLADLGIAQAGRVVVIGSDDIKDDRCSGVEIETIGCVQSAADIPNALRGDIAIVAVDRLDIGRADAEHLLARLRDVHSHRVLLLLDGDTWSADELRALGFLEQPTRRSENRVFFHDPDQFNEPREWNNPTSWANPKNFGKYRW